MHQQPPQGVAARLSSAFGGLGGVQHLGGGGITGRLGSVMSSSSSSIDGGGGVLARIWQGAGGGKGAGGGVKDYALCLGKNGPKEEALQGLMQVRLHWIFLV